MILALCVIIVTVALAQDDPQKTSDDQEIQTLFSNKTPVRVGWFASFEPGYTQFDGKDAWLGGVSGGMIINHSLSIGMIGHWWYDPTKYNGVIEDVADARFMGGYGGFLLEYTLFPKKLVHVTFPVIIGGGGASYVDNWQEWDKNSDHHIYASDAFFVFEPGVRAEINILKFMRFNLGVSYRAVSGLDLINTPSDKLQGFTLGAGLKFGKF